MHELHLIANELNMVGGGHKTDGLIVLSSCLVTSLLLTAQALLNCKESPL